MPQGGAGADCQNLPPELNPSLDWLSGYDDWPGYGPSHQTCRDFGMYLSTGEKLLMQSTDKAGAQPLLICFSAVEGLLAHAAFFQECFLLFSNQYWDSILVDTITFLTGWAPKYYGQDL